MPINLESAMGVHLQALQFRAKRSEVLATNLANADTPNYKAQDISFSSALAAASSNSSSSLNTTTTGHIKGAVDLGGGQTLLYRSPNQSSLDGNTVDTQVEQAEFTKNAVQYEATLTLVQHKLRGIISAIRGD